MDKRKSLGVKLVLSFMATSMIPIILITIFSYYNISNTVNKNNEELMKYNLMRTKTTLEISIDSYEDVLVQIYSDDDVVNLINKINRGENLVVSKNQLRRILRGYFYAKKYIRDISIITEDGTLVFYDSITGSITRSSWIPELGISPKELYHTYINENKTFVMSTGEVEAVLNKRNFLFHLGHRIVDFNKQNVNIGIVILGIDEEMLHNICSGGDQSSVVYSFIVDKDRKLVSYKEKDLLGSVVGEENEEKKEQYKNFVQQQQILGKNDISIDYVYDEKLGWDVVNVSNRHEVLGKINQQQKITLFTLAVSVSVLMIIISFLARGLTGSIKSVVKIMQSAGEGRLQERVQIDKKMPNEVKVIAYQYNTTMDQLVESVEKEKQLVRQKKDAEITALEAQLNPHFLYNTLDTINWIAIGRKEFEISRAITALAVILRYGIDDSNGIVTIREEYEWLKQYLFLQQTRLKDGFESSIEIPPELMKMRVHKLLIQPFVENSFIHGFENIKRTPILRIKMELWQQNRIKILIEDNGKGMPIEIAEQMNRGVFQESGDKNQIGLKNAIYRISLYYEDQADIQVESRENGYTRIYIILPVLTEGDEEAV